MCCQPGHVLSHRSSAIWLVLRPTPTSWISIVALLGFEHTQTHTLAIPLLIDTLLHNQHTCAPAVQFVFNGDTEFSSGISCLYLFIIQRWPFLLGYQKACTMSRLCKTSLFIHPTHSISNEIDYKQVIGNLLWVVKIYQLCKLTLNYS